MKIKRFIVIVTISSLLFGHADALANGFKILGIKSTKATAMGEAFIVQADDPSAVAFNPAGLSQLKGTQVSLGTTVTNGWVEYTSPAGRKEHNLDKWQMVPNAFLTSDLGSEDLTVGLGITLPNGLASNWDASGFARYVATFSELVVMDVNPTVAFKMNDHLSVGLGMSYYHSTATLRSMRDYGSLIALPGAFDGESRLEGAGDAFGYNLGILYRLNERHSFAATFKSGYKVDYDGEITLTGIPAFMGLGSTLVSDMKASIDFPAVIVLGYAWRPTEKLKLEVNVDWTNWDTLDTVTATFDNPALPAASYEYDYNNTFAYKFGVEYLLNERLTLRAGYIYNEDAAPDANWRPSLVDTTTQFVTGGFGWKVNDNYTVDGAVQAIFYRDRNINNNVDNNEMLTASSIDGKYENFALAFSIGATYRF